jgi:flagellar protein FlaF
MSVQAYQSTMSVTEDPRQTEYRLFGQVTGALIDASERELDGAIEAIDWNRRLWLTLQMALWSDSNRLGDELKAQLISLSIWVDKHSSKVLRGEAEIEPLISVNRSIMEGLAGRQ